jgi:hypothetical protein
MCTNLCLYILMPNDNEVPPNFDRQKEMSEREALLTKLGEEGSALAKKEAQLKGIAATLPAKKRGGTLTELGTVQRDLAAIGKKSTIIATAMQMLEDGKPGEEIFAYEAAQAGTLTPSSPEVKSAPEEPTPEPAPPKPKAEEPKEAAVETVVPSPSQGGIVGLDAAFAAADERAKKEAEDAEEKKNPGTKKEPKPPTDLINTGVTKNPKGKPPFQRMNANAGGKSAGNAPERNTHDVQSIDDIKARVGKRFDKEYPDLFANLDIIAGLMKQVEKGELPFNSTKEEIRKRFGEQLIAINQADNVFRKLYDKLPKPKDAVRAAFDKVAAAPTLSNYAEALQVKEKQSNIGKGPEAQSKILSTVASQLVRLETILNGVNETNLEEKTRLEAAKIIASIGKRRDPVLFGEIMDVLEKSGVPQAVRKAIRTVKPENAPSTNANAPETVEANPEKIMDQMYEDIQKALENTYTPQEKEAKKALKAIHACDEMLREVRSGKTKFRAKEKAFLDNIAGEAKKLRENIELAFAPEAKPKNESNEPAPDFENANTLDDLIKALKTFEVTLPRLEDKRAVRAQVQRVRDIKTFINGRTKMSMMEHGEVKKQIADIEDEDLRENLKRVLNALFGFKGTKEKKGGNDLEQLKGAQTFNDIIRILKKRDTLEASAQISAISTIKGIIYDRTEDNVAALEKENIDLALAALEGDEVVHQCVGDMIEKTYKRNEQGTPIAEAANESPEKLTFATAKNLEDIIVILQKSKKGQTGDESMLISQEIEVVKKIAAFLIDKDKLTDEQNEILMDLVGSLEHNPLLLDTVDRILMETFGISPQSAERPKSAEDLASATTFEEIQKILSSRPSTAALKRQLLTVAQIEVLIGRKSKAYLNEEEHRELVRLADSLKSDDELYQCVDRVINLTLDKNVLSRPRRWNFTFPNNKAPAIDATKYSPETLAKIAAIEAEIIKIDSAISEAGNVIYRLSDRLEKHGNKSNHGLQENDFSLGDPDQDLKDKWEELEALKTDPEYGGKLAALKAEHEELLKKKIAPGSKPPAAPPAPVTPKKNAPVSSSPASKNAPVQERELIIQSNIATMNEELRSIDEQIAALNKRIAEITDPSHLVKTKEDMKELQECKAKIVALGIERQNLMKELGNANVDLLMLNEGPAAESINAFKKKANEVSPELKAEQEADEKSILESAEEKKLSDALNFTRAKYFALHQKYVKGEKERGWKNNLKRFLGMSFSVDEAVVEKNKDLMNAKERYEEVLQKYGNHLFASQRSKIDKGGAGCIDSDELDFLKSEIERASMKPGNTINLPAETSRLERGELTAAEKKLVLDNYRSGKLFQQVVLDERALQVKARAESWTPKEKGWMRKLMDKTFLAKGGWGRLCRITGGALIFGGAGIGVGGMLPFLGWRVAKSFLVYGPVSAGVNRMLNEVPVFQDRSEETLNKNIKAIQAKVQKGTITLQQATAEIRAAHMGAEKSKVGFLVKRATALLAIGSLTGKAIAVATNPLETHLGISNTPIVPAETKTSLPHEIAHGDTDTPRGAAIPKAVIPKEETWNVTPKDLVDHNPTEKNPAEIPTPPEEAPAVPILPPDKIPSPSSPIFGGKTPEQPLPEAPAGKLDSIFSKEDYAGWVVGKAGGHNTWSIIKHVLAGTSTFENMTHAQQDNAIATLYEKMSESQQDMVLHDGDIIDLTKLVDAEGQPIITDENINEALASGDSLTAAEQLAITQNNLRVQEWLNRHPHTPLTEKIANKAIAAAHKKH